jgi:hypothetical protein
MSTHSSFLQVLAGPRAFQHIRQHGLSPQHIGSVFGASGAAKWLAIYGLDQAIFSRWLCNTEQLKAEQPIHLFGTSVGAWKLAAAAQRDPQSALTALANAYVAQSYGRKATMDDVVTESKRILAAFLPPEKFTEILQHPVYRFHFGAVRCVGGLGSEKAYRLGGSLAKAFWRSRKGRNALQRQVQRVVFSDPRQQAPLASNDGYKTESVALTTDNFYPAITASGSIPFVMPGVRDIPGAKPGVYRDGGLLDYHPVPGYFWQDNKLVLYPHFYPYLKPGWFDKFYSQRVASRELLDNVIILAPTQAFVDSLPFQRISDRKDFKRFRGRNEERQEIWHKVMVQSHYLGEEFLQLVNSGDIASQVQPL